MDRIPVGPPTPRSPAAVALLVAVVATLAGVVFVSLRGAAPDAGTVLATEERRPNVLLVTFDTTRADHVGFLGGRPDVTPMLDAMAARGVAFDEAITVQPLTLPSHTSILTGLYPDHHGVRNNGTYVVPPDTVTLAERLQDAGYATHAVVSSFVLDHRFGLDQGFDRYDDDLTGSATQPLFMFEEVTADRTAARARRWLAERPTDRPFFLWLHFFDPHADYQAPADVLAKFPDDPYAAEIAFADRELGTVLAALDDAGELDRTLFVFTADHGESLGEHGEGTHGIFVYDATARVPMAIAGPGVPKGRVKDVVRTVDLVPTILDLLGLPAVSGLDGTSLADVWEGDSTPRTAYIEAFAPRLNFGWSELRALRTDHAKAIDAPRREAYDLDADPGEAHDLLASAAAPTAPTPAPPTDPGLADLFRALDARKADDPFSRGEHAPAALDAATSQQLAALGYVWEASTSLDSRADPKDRLAAWTEFQRCQDLLRDDRDAEAIVALRALLVEDPANTTALGSLALAYARSGDTDRALATYEAMLVLDPARETTYLSASRMLLDADRPAEAEAMAQRLVDRAGASAPAWVALGAARTGQSRWSDAEVAYRRALALDARAAGAAGGLGNALNRSGRPDEALAVLADAYALDPADHTVTFNLGVVREQAGDANGALTLYARATELDPRHAMSWNNYGTLLERAGRHADALASIERAVQIDPRCREAVYNLGVMRLHDGRPDDAIALWRDAAPEWPDAWLAIAHAELQRGRPEQAREALARAVSSGATPLAPGDPLLALDAAIQP